MILHFALHIIFLIIFPISPLVSAQDGNGIIAHPGCNSRCGSVDITFPFGMKDPKCYADKWFEVECRRTSNTSSRARGVDKPYLKSLNLEVYHIDAHRSMVSIMNPIYRSNCQRKSNNSKAVINLRGSPFIYSQENTFLGVGCNNLAFLQSNGTTVCGCVSICDDDNNFGFGSDGCHGRYCCETSLPTHLSEYNATLQHLGEQSTVGSSSSHHGDQCSYALIVSNHWLSFQDYAYDYEIRNFNDLKNMDYAPAMLEWEILNSTVELPSDSHCYGSNVTSSTNKTSGRRCRCSYGYDGNPYVAGGCTEGYTQPNMHDGGYDLIKSGLGRPQKFKEYIERSPDPLQWIKKLERPVPLIRTVHVALLKINGSDSNLHYFIFKINQKLEAAVPPNLGSPRARRPPICPPPIAVTLPPVLLAAAVPPLAAALLPHFHRRCPFVRRPSPSLCRSDSSRRTLGSGFGRTFPSRCSSFRGWRILQGSVMEVSLIGWRDSLIGLLCSGLYILSTRCLRNCLALFVSH